MDRKQLDAVKAFTAAWLADYPHRNQARTRVYVRRMVSDVKVAFVRFCETGREPWTGNWHDNQCKLWETLIFNS